MSLSIRSSRFRVSLQLDVTVGDEDELEEDVEQWFCCLQSVLEVDWSEPEDELRWQAWNHDRNEVLRITLYSNPVFNEMWFLTIDPFVGISVFFAKLSKRQYCWRVFEDFHRQEYIQFFDIHRCLFMRLHFSIDGYDYRRTTRFRQSIHFSIIQVLFCWSYASTRRSRQQTSFLRFKSWCRQAPVFRRWEECCFVFLLKF